MGAACSLTHFPSSSRRAFGKHGQGLHSVGASVVASTLDHSAKNRFRHFIRGDRELTLQACFITHVIFGIKDVPKVNINGQLFDKEDAKISVYDHGLLYGDGVFEG